ncbi:MAG: hypothetical protein EOO89_07735 [Pedobacter sp.]|nr:MAG: hypothetical protein EOO89_07735 [Pedobacter sp.]
MTLGEIEDIEGAFHGIELPDGVIELNEATRITDVKAFIQAQLSIIKNAPDSRMSIPAYDRLLALKEIILGS